MSIKTLAALAAAVLAATPLAAQESIAAGETVAGTLEEGDRQMEDGALYDAYVIRGRPGETVVVRMRSDDFDTWLHWGREQGGQWVDEEENDDAGDGTDSRLTVRLGGDGRYELRAAGFDEEEQGAYALSVTAVTGEVRAGRLRVGQTVQGELSDGDYEGENGVEDHYVIQGAPGSQITVYAESDDFDTYLEFGAWRDGELDVAAQDDDEGEGTNSEMIAEFGDDGVHHVVVRSFSGEESGAYTLRVVEGAVSENWNDDGEGDEGDYDEDSEDSDAEEHDHEDSDSGDEEHDYDGEDFVGMGGSVLPIEAGETVEGTLDDEDPRTGEGHFYQDFSYQADEGERLTIRAASGEIDPYVFIGAAGGEDLEALGEDDDGGPGTDSELTFTIPEIGEYVIRVAAATPGQTGAFTLEVQSTR